MTRLFRLFAVLVVLSFAGSVESAPKPKAASHREDGPHIRLLILKHSIESMADGDADLAINAAKKAAAKGLVIKDVGNHYIDNNGKVQFYVWSDLPKLQEFVSQQMKVDAEPGDTLIVFTIGHGHEGGGLHNLGQRSDVMKAIAQAAEVNQQRTLWWQLSCHACAKLPEIRSLPASQQEYFSMFASSTANELSAAGVQGRIMERLFVAMAEKSPAVDPDGDGVILAKELKEFLNKDRAGRGNLFFAHDPSDEIFGAGGGLANQIPIIDRNRPQSKYPKNYIPVPKR